MGITKGSCVSCNKSKRIGVVSNSSPSPSLVYVQWLTAWNLNTKEFKHYMELVPLVDLDEIVSDKLASDSGLDLLRAYILR